MHHYWPVKNDDKCRSIKFAVDWGNSHQQKVTTIWFEFMFMSMLELRIIDCLCFMVGSGAGHWQDSSQFHPRGAENGVCI